MKKALLVMIAAISILASCNSKPKAPAGYDKVMGEIEQYYNSKDFGKIYDMYADTMKQALPLEQTTQVFDALYAQTGPIEKMTFTSINFGQAVYATTMEKGVLNTTIILDEQQKITGLWFRPE